MAEEAVLAALAGRRSVPQVDPDGPVPAAQIERAIALAILAPNHRLTFPWRFTVVHGASRRLAGEAVADEGVREGRLPEARRAFEAGKWLRAPAVVVVSYGPAPDPEVRREDRLAIGAAVENLLLALAAQDVAAMWRTGASARSAGVRRVLGLADGDEVLALVYVGRRPPEAPQAPRRRPAAEAVTRWVPERPDGYGGRNGEPEREGS